MSKSKIKPCPFCGKDLELLVDGHETLARCGTRQCLGGKLPMLNLDSPNDVARWNIREGCFDKPWVSREKAHEIALDMTGAVEGNYFFYHAELDQFLDRLSASTAKEITPRDEIKNTVREGQ